MTKQVSIKSITQAFAMTSADLATAATEIADKRKTDLGLTADASRREVLGEAGMRTECHAKANAKLAGMTQAAAKVFRTMPFKAEDVAQVGGLSREAKSYTLCICEAVGQGKHPQFVDFSNIAAEAKKIDPKFPAMRKGHKTITHLIEQLKQNNVWTLEHWDKEHNGETQGRYIINYLCQIGAATKTGSKGMTTITVNMDHAIISELVKL